VGALDAEDVCGVAGGGLSPFLFGLLLVAGVDLSVFGEAAAHHEF
jgi:hypothetical protein